MKSKKMSIANFMKNNYFQVVRGGLNSTFQDNGRENLYHIGLPFSGAMDKRNYLIANKLINNNEKDPVIEFAFQGPLLKYFGVTRDIVITGNVNFKIIKNEASMNVRDKNLTKFKSIPNKLVIL